MKSPFKEIDQAFDPMFEENVIITCDRGSSGTFKQSIYVIVNEDLDDEPLSDQMVNTDMERISIFCKESDWCILQKIQTGDTVERPEFSTRKYKVTSVERNHLLGITIKARTFTK